MDCFFFVLMVAVLGALLALSAVAAHARIGRHTAGWWTGLVLSIILLAAASDSFEALPTTTQSDGCTTSQVTDWDSVLSEAVRIDWFTVFAGVALAFLAIELLSRLELSDRVLALVLLIVALCSSFTIVYVFAIRKLSYLVFSLTMGGLAGSLAHVAFFSTRLRPPRAADDTNQGERENHRRRT